MLRLELDPGYVDTIVRRWQTLSGGSALHGMSSRSFDDLAREAEAANVALTTNTRLRGGLR